MASRQPGSPDWQETGAEGREEKLKTVSEFVAEKTIDRKEDIAVAAAQKVDQVYYYFL